MWRHTLTVLILSLSLVLSGCLVSKPAPETTTQILSSSSQPSTTIIGSSNQESSIVSSEGTEASCEGILWRYAFEDALSCAISRDEIDSLQPLAAELKREDFLWSVWNVLAWEEVWLTYDWEKAKEPSPEIVVHPNGTVEVKKGENRYIQRPSETLKAGKGICTDYAVFTVALLLAMNYTPVYAMEINFTEGSGHAAALVNVEGWYIVLDQKLPPMDLATYYRHWKRRNSTIASAKFYEVSLGESQARVRLVGIFSGVEFLKQDYTMKPSDEDLLAALMMKSLEEDLGAKFDPDLKSLGDGELPQGYRSGSYWRIEYPMLGDYYHPFFAEQYADWLLDKSMKNVEFRESLNKSDALWIEVEVEGKDLLITFYLGDA
ncbi:MAG: hypothetical protein PWQ79_290 [Thermococcaceae archaeon]|nr:hypothetical protein [Thermococcaceae archaeon]MDK2913375.1 hypothetical protein [Thermococcaceae archaeon]